jgi:uncharacterized membrane protein
MRPWLYLIYLLHALFFAFVISQFGFLATSVAAILTVLGVILWIKKRPSDFVVHNYLPRVFVASTYALAFFAGFLLLQKLQPMNYRKNDLAAVGIVAALLGIYSATMGRR